VRRASGQLFPGRRPQERVVNPLYFLSRYGSAVIEGARTHTAEWVSTCLAAARLDS